MASMNRREFVAGSLKGLGAASLGWTALSADRVLGANERVRFALIGCGGRGRFVARGLVEQGAELVYLCDLHSERLAQTLQFLEPVLRGKPEQTKDMRRVLDDKGVDAVVIATPDHWHALATIQACQAGKDVYVEKPHSLNIWESRKMVEAARKYDRVVQVGTQNRSAPYTLEAVEYVRSGELGTIGLVKVYNLKSGGEFWLGDPGTKPRDFDWNVWLGPAPERPYHQKIFRHGWLKFWDFAGGDMASDGIHQFDLAFMLLGDPQVPRKVACVGGRKVFRDDRQIPDVQVATFDFPDFVLTMEMTNYPRYMQKTTATIRRNDLLPYWTQNATRIELYGAELMMTIGRHGGGWQVTTSGGKVVKQMYGRPADDPHYVNFIQCVKDRKRPTADIEIAHNSLAAIHLANITHRMGNISLEFDAEKERIVGHADANRMLTRDYRKPFVIPEKV